VALPEAALQQLCELLERDPQAEITVDLDAQVAAWPGAEIGFALDPFTRECLLNGWDAVGLVLRHDVEIAAYEGRRSALLPQLR
jgi:3-isopropylmalate/(R)-2-methylmalate dehydratase small subunit